MEIIKILARDMIKDTYKEIKFVKVIIMSKVKWQRRNWLCQFTDYKNHKIDWKKKLELEKFVININDVIVPSSGGKIAHLQFFKKQF